MHVNLLHRPLHALAQCWLDPGERVIAESGALVGMSTNVRVETQSGGIMSGLKRMLAGESFYRNTFTAEGGRGEVLFATPLPGDMAVLEVGDAQWCVQSSAYVASTPGVAVSARSGGLRGVFSGAGLFALETAGEGQMILGAFGALERVPVEGHVVVDTGHLAAWESTLSCRIGKSTSTWLGSWLSGEGLVCHVEGRGSLWIQSRSAGRYGAAVGPRLAPRQP
ncbi:TIGR00266 family protein [Sorangium sp. So ce1036]|uniref:TIGR00266 family protein n=1 Tax=Sorangium sp. So ce1036 TaxID=3133328 RepID=UPI003F0CF5AE